MPCLAEDELFDLAHARRRLGEAPALEAHLADCAACSALLSALVDAAPVDAPPDRAGTTLGPYRLDGLIGAGAMGEVYRGWDLRLHRHVAVKLLSRVPAGSQDRARRFEVEARAAAAIAHANVVTVYDTGTHDGVPYVVSELIAGESLRSVIDRGPIAPRTALELTLQLARGLVAAHAQGVVHRDLKPSNLIVTDDGSLKILDFGLAKVVGDRDAEATEPGTLLGTSGYLSPEQARGEPTDARSDLFAVGAIAYEMLSGARAFGGATFAERLSAVLRDTPPAIEHPAAPIVMRCLEKEPRKRFQSAADLVWVLEAPLAVEPPAPRPRPPRVVSRRAFVVGAAAAGLGGLVLGRALGTRAPRPAVAEYRQLTFRQGRVASARFTPDGGSILYSAAWEELPLAAFTIRLGGGGTRPLPLPTAQLLAVSSRGDLALSLKHAFVDGFHQRGRLAIAPLEGGEPRALGIDVQDADFTPSGDDFAIVRRAGELFRLELPVGRVLLEAGWLSRPRISPDGALIACLRHATPGDDRGDLVVVPRHGGAPRTLAEDWSSIDGVAWAPSGRAVWVSASRAGGNNSLWAIGLDGRELAHVTSAGRLRLHDVGRDGELVVTQTSGRLHMMARAPGARDDLDLGLSDISLVSDISGDGRQVVFVEFGDVDTAHGAYLRPTSGGPALWLGDGVPVDLADDGRGVLAQVYGFAPTFAVLPVPEGQPRALAIAGLADIQWLRWAAAGRIVVCGAAAGRRPRLWRLDPDRRLTELADEGVVGVAAVSPDGLRVALIAGDRLVVVDVDRREPPRTVTGSFDDELVCGWSRDGTEVFVRSSSPPIQVRRVDVASAASRFAFEVAPPRLGLRGVTALVVSDDADAYAYSYSQELSRLYTMTAEDLGS